MQCAPYLIRKIKYCIMFCWAWYTCCSLKKVPMATWRSRKPQARHRVKYPRCCQWWLMSSSRLKFHERDFARRHRRRGEYSVCSGQAKSMKLAFFRSSTSQGRKKNRFLRWRLNDPGRQESSRGLAAGCGFLFSLVMWRPCGQPDSLVVLHCDTMSLQNRTSVEPSDRREEDMSSNNAIKKTVGRQSKASQALTRCTPYSQPWRCMYYLTNRISNNFWKKEKNLQQC